MPKKCVIALLSLVMLFSLAVPAFATDQSTSSAQPTANSTVSTGPLSGLAQDEKGLRPITPIDLNALGNKAVNFGNRSYEFLIKGSVPLFVWAVGGSIVVLLLGIFFGKKIIVKGVVGIIISLAVVALIHYIPQIAITVKNAAGSALTP